MRRDGVDDVLRQQLGRVLGRARAVPVTAEVDRDDVVAAVGEHRPDPSPVARVRHHSVDEDGVAGAGAPLAREELHGGDQYARHLAGSRLRQRLCDSHGRKRCTNRTCALRVSACGSAAARRSVRRRRSARPHPPHPRADSAASVRSAALNALSTWSAAPCGPGRAADAHPHAGEVAGADRGDDVADTVVAAVAAAVLQLDGVERDVQLVVHDDQLRRDRASRSAAAARPGRRRRS